MRKLIVFNQISLDGCFVDAKGDMSWAHKSDPEWSAFTAENAKGEAQMLFGRITYELMASYWPTPIALKSMPTVANAMNNARKIVFSKTLTRATWNNTQLVKGDPVAEVRKLKNEAGPGMVIFGSGTMVAQLAPERLIDEYQVAVIPVVLGKGRTMFEGVKERLNLKLIRSRTFNNGNVFLCYEHA